MTKRAEEKAIRKFSGIEDETEDERTETAEVEADKTPEAASEPEEVTEVLETQETPEEAEEVVTKAKSEEKE